MNNQEILKEAFAMYGKLHDTVANLVEDGVLDNLDDTETDKILKQLFQGLRIFNEWEKNNKITEGKKQ